jgi:hypothetical protein
MRLGIPLTVIFTRAAHSPVKGTVVTFSGKCWTPILYTLFWMHPHWTSTGTALLF